MNFERNDSDFLKEGCFKDQFSICFSFHFVSKCSPLIFVSICLFSIIPTKFLSSPLSARSSQGTYMDLISVTSMYVICWGVSFLCDFYSFLHTLFKEFLVYFPLLTVTVLNEEKLRLLYANNEVQFTLYSKKNLKKILIVHRWSSAVNQLTVSNLKLADGAWPHVAARIQNALLIRGSVLTAAIVLLSC